MISLNIFYHLFDQTVIISNWLAFYFQLQSSNPY